MEKLTLPRLLIIAGTGRNTGKTTLACTIIRRFSPLKSVTGIKITPHFHKNSESCKVLIDAENLYVAEETNSSTGKDSSMMLEAGAVNSYFVMVRDENIREAFNEIFKLIPSDTMLVCESGGLRHHVVPGLFIMMKNSGTGSLKPGAEKLMRKADRVITFDGEKIDFDTNRIEITDNRWTLKLT